MPRAIYERRQFLSTVAMTAGAALLLRSPFAWAEEALDPRVADIVAKTIGIEAQSTGGQQ